MFPTKNIKNNQQQKEQGLQGLQHSNISRANASLARAPNPDVGYMHPTAFSSANVRSSSGFGSQQRMVSPLNVVQYDSYWVSRNIQPSPDHFQQQTQISTGLFGGRNTTFNTTSNPLRNTNQINYRKPKTGGSDKLNNGEKPEQLYSAAIANNTEVFQFKSEDFPDLPTPLGRSSRNTKQRQNLSPKREIRTVSMELHANTARPNSKNDIVKKLKTPLSSVTIEDFGEENEINENKADKSKADASKADESKADKVKADESKDDENEGAVGGSNTNDQMGCSNYEDFLKLITEGFLKNTIEYEPSTMSAEPYGLDGLLTKLGTDSNENNIHTKGMDLSTLGLDLNQKEPLYETFNGPFGFHPTLSMNVPHPMPRLYLLPEAEKDKVPDVSPEMMHDDKLFYMFYTMVRDIWQIKAAVELYNRNWRYHTVLKSWIRRAPSCNDFKIIGTKVEGHFQIFDPIKWKTTIMYDVIDESYFEEKQDISKYKVIPSSLF